MKPIVKHSSKQLEKLRNHAKEKNLPEGIYEDFSVFAHYMVPSWGREELPWEWFHYYICKHFQRLIEGNLSYLSLETHSQLGKSVLVALFIIYVFGLNPDKNVMYFTYNETAAIKFTKDYIFAFMGSDKYHIIFPYVILKNNLDKGDHTAKSAMQKKRSTLKDNEFNVINPLLKIDDHYQGKYVAFGLGQGSHGRPADIMIVDDYVAKAEDVSSEIFREKMETAFNSDIILRFQASTIFMIICTRWYERDSIGLLLEKMPQVIAGFVEAGLEPPKFESIKIRAEYRKDDINPVEDPRTENGEFLWKPMLAKYLLAKGGKYYNAVFNCDPSDIEKTTQLKATDFGYYLPEDLPPRGGRIYISMDGASTIGKHSDHTAIGQWLVFGKKRYLQKIWLFKKEIPELVKIIINILTVEVPDYFDCLIEYANSGVSISQYLDEKNIKHTPLGFSGKSLRDNAITTRSKKDITSKTNSKMDRYLRTIPEFQHPEKRILLPAYPIEHQDKLVKQMITFTGNANEQNDLVDMCTYLINYTSRNIIISSNLNNYAQNNLPKYSGMSYNLSNGNYFIPR